MSWVSEFSTFYSKQKRKTKLKTIVLSRLGGITIAWVELSADQVPQIVMLQPFCHKDFGIRSIGDRIKDLNQCVTLYPDIPKDKAFGTYYTPISGECFI